MGKEMVLAQEHSFWLDAFKLFGICTLNEIPSN
jgi:hypothetical protein